MKRIVKLEVIMANAMKNMDKNDKFFVAKLPLEYLDVAPNQRDRISKAGIDKKAKKWDNGKCGALKGTWHYGDQKVLLQDGQHRFLAAKRAISEYGKEIDGLFVLVYPNLSHDEEIDLFLYQDEGVNKLRYCDKFKSILMKQHRNETEQAMFSLMQICDRRGILLQGYNNKNISTTKKIGSIKKSYEIIQNQGIECFDWIVDILEGSKCDYLQGAWNGCFLKTLASFYKKEDANETKYSLIELLKFKKPSELCKDARWNEALFRKAIEDYTDLV